MPLQRVFRAALWRIAETVGRVAARFGADVYQRTDDRRILETVILPHFSDAADHQKILFVGCDWYTRGYRRFFPDKDYWTLDIDPRKRKYGSDRHIIDSVAHVGRHFAPGALDLIVCNGVIGWGLNDRQEIETAFRECHRCLRPGGIFLLGWNDVPEHRPLAPADSASLRLFDAHVFPPLGVPHLLTDNPNRHSYNFYAKPRGPA